MAACPKKTRNYICPAGGPGCSAQGFPRLRVPVAVRDETHASPQDIRKLREKDLPSRLDSVIALARRTKKV
jgi:hypothetical protein